MKSSHCPKYERKNLGNATTSYFHFEIFWPLIDAPLLSQITSLLFDKKTHQAYNTTFYGERKKIHSFGKCSENPPKPSYRKKCKNLISLCGKVLWVSWSVHKQSISLCTLYFSNFLPEYYRTYTPITVAVLHIFFQQILDLFVF